MRRSRPAAIESCVGGVSLRYTQRMNPYLKWVLGGVLLSFCACGDDSSDESENSEPSTDENEATDEVGSDAPDAEAPTDDGETDTADTAATDPEATDGGGTDSVVLMGDDGVSIEITYTESGADCGTELCRNALISGLPAGVPGCCFDEEEETCGFDMRTLGLFLNLNDPGCEQLDKPGSSDPSCPESEPINTGAIPGAPDTVVMPGCCQENGECGFAADFGDFGFGCIGPDRFSQESSGECDYQP